MNKIFMIFILILQFFSCSMADTFKVPLISTETSERPGTSNPASYVSSADNAGGNFELKEGYPIIYRTVNPIYKDFTLKNKASDVEVQILGSGRDFDNILIKEIIDKKLKNISNIKVYIEDPIFSIKREVHALNVTDLINNESIGSMLDKMKENYTFYDNSLYIKIPKLKSGESVNYSYRVFSPRSGIFNAITLFRLKGSKWQDLENRDTLEVRPPEIEVSAEMDQSCAIRKKFLNVTYNILHKSGWCNDELNVNISFNNSDQYTIYYENKTPYANEFIPLTLKPLEATKYPIKIIYNYAGRHPVPSLYVEGATVFQRDADVDVLLLEIFKGLQDVQLLMSFLSVIIVIIVSAFDIRYIRKREEEIKRIQGQIDQINYQLGSEKKNAEANMNQGSSLKDEKT